MPGFLKTINARVSMITSWAFPHFDADMKLCNADGEKNVALDLHLPIPYHPKEIAFPMAVIFKPCKGKLAVLCGGSPKTLSRESLIEAGAPLGAQISDKMFPID